MDARSDDRLGIGGNNPPEPTLTETLSDRYADLFGEVEPLATRANALPASLETDDQVGETGDVVTDAVALKKRIDDARKKEKAPIIAAGKEVDALFNAALDRLARISNALTQRVTDYNRAKAAAERRRREEEERKAREQAEAARLDAAFEAEGGDIKAAEQHFKQADLAEQHAEEAAQPVRAADLTRVRSEGGTTVSTKTEVKARVVDWDAIDLNKLRHFFKREDVEKALRAFTRINKKSVPIAGVEFYDEETAQFRR